ncbi:hypothetical protein AB0H00_22390 [Nocardia sp. NPDC023852]|uniref:hypothetical protein n=1 Tax=Nocardia sp. NPDC023852 TaxID=3154697 RepID=UPI0033EF6A6F
MPRSSVVHLARLARLQLGQCRRAPAGAAAGAGGFESFQGALADEVVHSSDDVE